LIGVVLPGGDLFREFAERHRFVGVQEVREDFAPTAIL